MGMGRNERDAGSSPRDGAPYGNPNEKHKLWHGVLVTVPGKRSGRELVGRGSRLA